MDIKIPEVGESVREALLAKWFKKSGDVVKRDEPLCHRHCGVRCARTIFLRTR